MIRATLHYHHIIPNFLKIIHQNNCKLYYNYNPIFHFHPLILVLFPISHILYFNQFAHFLIKFIHSTKN